MAYAILRVAKLTTFGNIGASGAHNYRERDTENADPERKSQNEHHGCRSGSELVEAVRARLPATQNGGRAIRKDAVRCLEFLITASPEWFRDRGDSKGYFADAVAWLRKRYGDNLVGWSIHRDETSPHLVAYVVPLAEDGRLSAKDLIGGRSKLGRMQSEFAAAVGAPYGLERGVEKSGAHHQVVKRFYGAITRPFEPLPTVRTPKAEPLPPATFMERLPWGAAHKRRQEQEAARAAQVARRRKEIGARQAAAVAVVERHQDQARAGAAMGEQLRASRKEQTRLREENAKIERRYNANALNHAEEMAVMLHERDEIYRCVGALIKASYTPAELAQAFGVEIKGKADIFDSLVKAGKAPDFKAALELVATKLPSKTGQAWSALAQWSLDFEKAKEVLGKGSETPAPQSKPEPSSGTRFAP